MNPPVNLELIHPNPGDVIVMSVDFSDANGHTIDAMREAFYSLSVVFPQNRIICVPNGMSMVMASKDMLINIRNAANQILKSIEKER